MRSSADLASWQSAFPRGVARPNSPRERQRSGSVDPSPLRLARSVVGISQQPEPVERVLVAQVGARLDDQAVADPHNQCPRAKQPARATVQLSENGHAIGMDLANLVYDKLILQATVLHRRPPFPHALMTLVRPIPEQ